MIAYKNKDGSLISTYFLLHVFQGFYRGINCKLGVGAFLFFPVTGYYWKVKIQMNSENGQLLLCVLAEAQISVTRS